MLDVTLARTLSRRRAEDSPFRWAPDPSGEGYRLRVRGLVPKWILLAAWRRRTMELDD